jgi:Resolvase, N terminal domain
MLEVPDLDMRELLSPPSSDELAELVVYGVARLSKHRDESTSIPRQTAHIQRWTAYKGGKLLGVAADVDVSGKKVSPWDRPELGPVL